MPPDPNSKKKVAEAAKAEVAKADAKHAQIVGFRYFNVYGPRESHKGRMASVAFHHYNQLRNDGKVRLFPRDGVAAPQILDHGRRVLAVAWSPDGRQGRRHPLRAEARAVRPAACTSA